MSANQKSWTKEVFTFANSPWLNDFLSMQAGPPTPYTNLILTDCAEAILVRGDVHGPKRPVLRMDRLWAMGVIATLDRCLSIALRYAPGRITAVGPTQSVNISAGGIRSDGDHI